MDLLTVLTRCSVPTDFKLLLSLVLTFSGGQPYTVRTIDELYDALDAADDATAGEASTAATARAPALSRPQALAKLQALVAGAGVGESAGAVMVGLAPVPIHWAALYQQTPEALLNACTNISIASAQLSEFEAGCARARDSRLCALKRYAESMGEPAFADEVLLALEQQASSEVASETMLASPVFAERRGGERVWGADRLFVPEPPREQARQRAAKEQLNKSKQDKDKGGVR